MRGKRLFCSIFWGGEGGGGGRRYRRMLCTVELVFGFPHLLEAVVSRCARFCSTGLWSVSRDIIDSDGSVYAVRSCSSSTVSRSHYVRVRHNVPQQASKPMSVEMKHRMLRSSCGSVSKTLETLILLYTFSLFPTQ